MSFYKVTVNVDGRNLETLVKEGVLASIEVGKHTNKVKKPSHKIVVIAGQKNNTPMAWMQVSKIDGSASIVHEGWIGDGQDKLVAVSSASAPAKASVESVNEIPEKSLKSLQNAGFGVFGCCTSYGSGCYVTCCNGCCSDPVGCPGASCCG
ncbi:MAG TPA: hypothetical protein VN310_03925 [Candidatus Dormibacteraeota bacterium]|jgi:hypothetical protein|nr:hypothetical protein [Candidatus Dormibacteraeota bacterium]